MGWTDESNPYRVQSLSGKSGCITIIKPVPGLKFCFGHYSIIIKSVPDFFMETEFYCYYNQPRFEF